MMSQGCTVSAIHDHFYWLDCLAAVDLNTEEPTAVSGSMMSESSPRSDLPTAESLPDHLFRLALPVLGEQLLVFSIDSFDVYLAGQLGTAETSAIGLAS